MTLSPQPTSNKDGTIGVNRTLGGAVPEVCDVRSVVIFASPKAGSGLGRDQIPRLVSMLETQSITVELTDSISRLRQLVDESAASGQGDAFLVITAGGDGTLSLVAEHVSPLVQILPMPLGTENLLARYFGLTASADQLFSIIQSGRTIQIDAGCANGKLFLVVASAGFDAEVVRGMHLTRRGHIRRFDYAGPMLRAVRRYGFPDIETRIDGELYTGSPLKWAMVFNLPRYAAGLAIEPDACGDDGVLDLIGFKRGSILSGLRYVGGVFCGVHRNWSDVVRRRSEEIELTSKARVPYQLDGDYVGHLPLVIETLPGRVRLRVSAAKPVS
jgi:diacylglycerol kinase (ATP)